MSHIKAISYDHTRKSEWDAFVAQAKNGVFLFCRDYLEYHADRFPDASLMFYRTDGQLGALMPATIRDGMLSSHAGLTFGGVVSDNAMKAALMLEVFDALRANLIERGLKGLSYKAVPHIYHRLPAEEDLYALYRHGAKMVRRDISSAILLQEKLSFSKGRKWALKQANKHGLEVRRSDDFAGFMAIEQQVLSEKHNLRPVHTAEEIQLLAGRFPNNIKLFSAYCDGEMLAGVVMYESDNVAHAQYMAANNDGKLKGALDLVLDYLISEYYRDKKYFDFGISTEDDGRYLNSGLIENKQSFGARAIVHDFYQITLADCELE
jgi:hypothetical protein